MLKAETIKKIARETGFDLCGIAPVREMAAEHAFFTKWLEAGYGSGLEYLKRNIEKRFSPELLMPGARSIIVCAVNYKNDTSLGYDESGKVKIASYARSADYHGTIKGMLAELAGKLASGFGAFEFRTFSDTAPLLEKQWAVEAGLGFIGRNSLLISPEYGSFLLLGELIVDVEVDRYDTPVENAGCGECRRCVEKCPNGAITSGGIDTRRCIARLTIEKLPGESSGCMPPLHGWIFGCDKCQSVCPYNRDTPFYINQAFAPRFDPRTITSEDWLAMTQQDFNSRFSGTPLERAGLERLVGLVRQNELSAKEADVPH